MEFILKVGYGRYRTHVTRAQWERIDRESLMKKAEALVCLPPDERDQRVKALLREAVVHGDMFACIAAARECVRDGIPSDAEDLWWNRVIVPSLRIDCDPKSPQYETLIRACWLARRLAEPHWPDTSYGMGAGRPTSMPIVLPNGTEVFSWQTAAAALDLTVSMVWLRTERRDGKWYVHERKPRGAKKTK